VDGLPGEKLVQTEAREALLNNLIFCRVLVGPMASKKRKRLSEPDEIVEHDEPLPPQKKVKARQTDDDDEGDANVLDWLDDDADINGGSDGSDSDDQSASDNMDGSDLEEEEQAGPSEENADTLDDTGENTLRSNFFRMQVRHKLTLLICC